MRTIDRGSKVYGDSNRGRKASDEEDTFLQSVSQSEEEEEGKESDSQEKKENNHENQISSKPNCNLNKEAVKADKMKLSKEYLVLEVLGKGG